MARVATALLKGLLDKVTPELVNGVGLLASWTEFAPSSLEPLFDGLSNTLVLVLQWNTAMTTNPSSAIPLIAVAVSKPEPKLSLTAVDPILGTLLPLEPAFEVLRLQSTTTS